MIQKLKKRRPSENNQRPAELSVRIPNSTYAAFHLDSATSRGTGGAASARPLAGLPDLSVNQGDFRGSIIIDTLSKRFSVLRAKASPVRATFPTFPATSEYASQSSGIEEIRQRLAAQRQRAKETGRYVAEDEENLVLEELALPEDHYARVVSPLDVEFPPSTSDREDEYHPLKEQPRNGSRTYGFGATSGMKEAEVMMRARTGKRSVSDRSVGSGATHSRSGTPLSEHRDEELLQAPAASGKRKSMLAMLPVETQERITNALLEIEENMQAEAMEAEMIAEPQPSETLVNDAVREGLKRSQKSSQPITPQHKRQNSSISRSPFRENLAQIAKGIDVGESGSTTHSRSHSRTHSRATSSISISQPDFTVKQISSVHSATSSRQSSRRGHSRAGSSADLNRFRFGSGLAERLEDVSSVFGLPPPAPAPTVALPPIPTPPQSYYESPDERQDVEPVQKQQHQRTPSASASPIPVASLETGYVPGSARPFTSPRADSPLERVGNHDFGTSGPPMIGSRVAAPPLVRKGSKLIPPNRPGPLMLQPMLMPRAVTASSLPSVSPVVETFADSAERKGYTVPGPYSAVETLEGEVVEGLDIPQKTSRLGDVPADSGALGASPLDVSFDIDGYYGAGRSPVEAIARYPSHPQAERPGDDKLRPPSSLPQQPVDRELKTRPSLETLQSTFTESSTDLPSPALYNFPNLVVKRIESGSTSPLSDIFGSDVGGGGDDGKQELFDELQAMQERLLQAAREVRKGLNAGTPAGDRKRKDATPGLRIRPSIRARKPEPSMYPDLGENVSQLVRAMTQRQPSESSFRQQPSPTPSLHDYEDTPAIPALHSAFASNQTMLPSRDSPILDTEFTPRVDNYSLETVHPTPKGSPLVAITSTFSSPPMASNIDARSKLLGSPINSVPSRMGNIPRTEDLSVTAATARPAAAPGNANLEAEDDLARRLDFEARIAQATAQLQQTPITQAKRRPSIKGSAINIGSPTLINSSAKLSVTPLSVAQARDGASKASSPPSAFAKHTRHQSSSAVNVETSNDGKGLKGFMAKIKRNASLAERKRAKTPSSSPRVAQTPFQAVTPLSFNSNGSEGFELATPVMLTSGTMSGTSSKANISFPITRQGSQKHSDPLTSRKSVVRRTIIFSTSNNENITESMPNVEALPMSGSSPTRRPSTRRKPVRHLSGDTDLLRAEGLLAGPESQSISQVMASTGTANARQRRPSEPDSLYDMYAGSSNQDDDLDPEEVIYSGARASFGENSRPGHAGLSRSRSIKPRAIEIREMSDGQTTWGLVDVNDPLLRGIEAPPSSHVRNDSLTSSLSSYGGESQISRGSAVESGKAEISRKQSGDVRPKTNVFYSHEDDVAELIDDLSKNGFEGKFRIVSPTGDHSQSHAQSQPQPYPHAHDQTAELLGGISTMGVMEKKLQALVQRMLTTPSSST